MKWRRLGHVYSPSGKDSWALAHAMLPTPFVLSEDVIRVFYAGTNSEMIGSISFVDLSANDPTKVLHVHPRPSMERGRDGCFDDNGVLPTFVMRDDKGRLLLYYVGYQLCHRIRYSLLMGLAISEDNGESFTRHKSVPLLERIQGEEFFRTALWIEPSTMGYRGWYVAGNTFISVNGKQLPCYSVHYLESKTVDGWQGNGKRVLPAIEPDEHGIGRPSVVKIDGKYHMWFSSRLRESGYEIRHAESTDGLNWIRTAELGLYPSNEPWENTNVCYSAVITIKNKTYMFYNGNDFGRTGFGVAILE